MPGLFDPFIQMYRQRAAQLQDSLRRSRPIPSNALTPRQEVVDERLLQADRASALPFDLAARSQQEVVDLLALAEQQRPLHERAQMEQQAREALRAEGRGVLLGQDLDPARQVYESAPPAGVLVAPERGLTPPEIMREPMAPEMTKQEELAKANQLLGELLDERVQRQDGWNPEQFRDLSAGQALENLSLQLRAQGLRTADPLVRDLTWRSTAPGGPVY